MGEAPERFAALKKAKELDRHLPEGYWGAHNPKCPHCGKVCDLGGNDWWHLCEEGEHEVTCPECDDEFTVSTRVSFSFSTNNQD